MADVLSTEMFGFNLERLEVGDILLSLGDSTWGPKIARMTGGPYSHAMLYVGFSVIHADLDGVYSKNPQRLIFDSPDNLKVLRLNRVISGGEMNTLCEYARYWVGALYSKADASATLVLRNQKKRAITDKQFCSRLVAQAYSAIGIQLVKNPDYCSPNDLLRSPEVIQVGDGIKKLDQAEIFFAASDDYNEQLQRATFSWLEKVRSLAERRKLGNVVRHADVAPFLVRNPGYDKVVTQYAIESGYPNFARVDRICNSYRYDPQEFVLKFMSEGVSASDIISKEQRSIDIDRPRREANYKAFKSMFDQLPLKYFMLEIELGHMLLSELNARQQTLNVVQDFLDGKCPLTPLPYA